MAEKEHFDLVIDFLPCEGDPSRVFRAMSGLIQSMQALDRHLISSIDISLSASLVLEDIERGSLKARLKTVMSGIPDEALETIDWKKIVGPYLVRAKKRILRWCGERNSVQDRRAVSELEVELVEIAEQTNLKALPAYAPLPAEVLLHGIRGFQESLAPLHTNDSARFEADGERIPFNRNLTISNEVVREVLTQQIAKSTGERIVKVKKPDYLGNSMWSIVYDGRAFDAKISDDQWLTSFQARSLDVRPGDALRVSLYEEVSFGYSGEIVHRHCEIRQVLEIIRPPDQRLLDF